MVAVDQAREAKPDLVLLDITMQVLDGISAAEQITAEGLAPVVLLTAFSDKDLVERARDAGVMAYVVKPFTLADLEPRSCWRAGGSGRSRRCAARSST